MTEATRRQSHLTIRPSSPFSLSFGPNHDQGSTGQANRDASTHSRNVSAALSDAASNRVSDSTTLVLGSYRPSEDTAPAGHSPLTSPQLHKITLSTRVAFIFLTLSIFLVALDTVLIPTALPTVALSFQVPDSLYVWVGSAYLLANAASVPFWGKLSDVFGRKPIILVANTIFLIGSLICAISINAVMLVAGRAVQGLGGGGVVVLVHVCVADIFAIRDRSFYLGIVGAAWAVASALGPVLGGIFAQRLTWRWCFYINLPIVSVSTSLLAYTLRVRTTRTPLVKGLLSIDWLGTITILLATLLLLIGLQFGGQMTYVTPIVISFLIVAGLAFALFPYTQYLCERNDGAPIMPLRIFRDLSNSSALGVCACDALVFNSVAYFLPIYFQLVLDKSPSTSGIFMLAIAIPLAIVSFLTGHVINKTGRFLPPLQLGLGFMTLGVGLLISLPSTTSLGLIIGFLVIIGIGFGPNFHAPLIALQNRIQERDIAAGTAAFGFVRMVSGAIGVVVGQVVFQALLSHHRKQFDDAGIGARLVDKVVGGDAISEIHSIEALDPSQRKVVHDVLTQGLRGTWILFTVISAIGLFTSFGIQGRKLESGRQELDQSRSETNLEQGTNGNASAPPNLREEKERILESEALGLHPVNRDSLA